MFPCSPKPLGDPHKWNNVMEYHLWREQRLWFSYKQIFTWMLSTDLRRVVPLDSENVTYCKVKENGPNSGLRKVKSYQTNDLLRQGRYSYMAKYNALSYRHNSIHVGEGLELVFFIPTHHVKLFDALLFRTLSNDEWIWHDCFCKLDHLFIISCREQQHLTIFR